MASAVSAVIDTRLISILAQMAWHILEGPAGQPPNTPNDPTPGTTI
jgi:hypothetical protein